MGKKENAIEQYLAEQIMQTGGDPIKYSAVGIAGYPDRICAMPLGITLWVEAQAPGEKPRDLQLYYLGTLQKLGHHVCWVSTKDEVDQLIFQYKEIRDGKRTGISIKHATQT